MPFLILHLIHHTLAYRILDISSLYIFSKNTDATDVLKGYQYQLLATLETWLGNKVKNINETIYCDYEEDIFQHDRQLQTAKFRQLKLYSSNFSFSSVEVKKSIAHFFMLYVKADYLFDEVEFIFETNSSIKESYPGNHAELLRKWFDEQDHLSDGLLDESAALVKDVLTAYVAEQVAKLTGKVELKPEIQKAKEVFDRLTDENFKAFAAKIRWRFSNITSDAAIEQRIENIKSLLQALPYPVTRQDLTMTIGRLHLEIFNRSAAKDKEAKKLDNALIDSILLNIGPEDDRIYNDIYTKWATCIGIKGFNTGEFFEIIHAIEYCRYRKYLNGHDAVWKSLLLGYLALPNVPRQFFRKAVYELCLLSLRLDEETYIPSGNLFGLEGYIADYFTDFVFATTEIHDVIALLTICETSIKTKASNLTLTFVSSLKEKIQPFFKERLANCTEPNERCLLLDMETRYGFAGWLKDKESLSARYNEIIGLLPQATQFDVSSLYDQLNKYLNILIKVTPPNWETSAENLEEIVNRLQPFVIQKDGNYKIAKKQIEEGALYLDKNHPKYLLRALHKFHVGTNYYKNDNYIEGYVLGLLNIAQLYIVAGMNLAAKHYALSAIWFSFGHGKDQLFKRVVDAFGLLVIADFAQGAWLNTISDFKSYLQFRYEFKDKEFDATGDEQLDKILTTQAFIFAGAPRLVPEISSLLMQEANGLGWIWEDFLSERVTFLSDEFPSTESLNALIAPQINDQPLNDVGKTRVISWKAFGCNWSVEFENDYQINYVAEEFCVVLQVMQIEMSDLSYDFHLLKSVILIKLEIGEFNMLPEQLPSNEILIWKVILPVFDQSGIFTIRDIYNNLVRIISVILSEASVLKPLEFLELFKGFFKASGLDDKTLIVNGYQRIYKEFFSEEDFAVSVRQSFLEVTRQFDLPRNNPILPWRNDLSQKYDPLVSKKHIVSRYENSLKHFSITLARYKDQIDFNLLIRSLRKEGWLDWHICLGLLSFTVSYRANVLVNSAVFGSPEEKMEAFRAQFAAIYATGELSSFLPIPVADIVDQLSFYMDDVPSEILASWGLSKNNDFPNFAGVRELLNHRFNFNRDDVHGADPIAEIGRELTVIELQDRISSFQFFAPESSNVGVYVFTFDNQLNAWDFINYLEALTTSNEVDIEIEYTRSDQATVSISDVNGSGELILTNIKMEPDFIERIKAYEKKHRSLSGALVAGMPHGREIPIFVLGPSKQPLTVKTIYLTKI